MDLLTLTRSILFWRVDTRTQTSFSDTIIVNVGLNVIQILLVAQTQKISFHLKPNPRILTQVFSLFLHKHIIKNKTERKVNGKPKGKV